MTKNAQNTEIQSNSPKNMPRTCAKCGCTDSTPCYHPHFGYCWWVEGSELCSHCLELEGDHRVLTFKQQMA